MYQETFYTTKWYQRRKRNRRTPIVNGQYHGVEKWWHKNGKLANIIPYTKGERNGRLKYWDENGDLRLQLDYKNNIDHGLEIRDYDFDEIKEKVGRKLNILTNKFATRNGVQLRIVL